jgi:transcription elongation factor/antiterminator RfaH
MPAALFVERSSWYAVFTRSRQEKIAASMLEYQAVEHFLPLQHEERQWSDRKQVVSVPLFPGYLFVRIVRSSDLLLRVLKVPGIVDFVRDANGPLAIPQHEIENVRAVLVSGTTCSLHPYLKAGDRVRVIDGPLKGVEGTFVRAGSQAKLVISVEMIQRSVAVSVAETNVEPVFPDFTLEPPRPCIAADQGLAEA